MMLRIIAVTLVVIPAIAMAFGVYKKNEKLAWFFSIMSLIGLVLFISSYKD